MAPGLLDYRPLLCRVLSGSFGFVFDLAGDKLVGICQ
jgi:hypothetical protein